MHNTLVHAQHSCACTALLCMRGRGQGLAGPGPGRLGWWAWFVRFWCMHNTLVYALELLPEPSGPRSEVLCTVASSFTSERTSACKRPATSILFGSSLSAPAGDSIIAHSFRRVPPHFLTMKVFTRVIFAMLFVAIAAMLQGCGCDEDAAKKCTTATCATYTKCFSDASCCDYEKDGAKVKDALTILCALTPTETNSCA